jgi:hypothetical protein
MRFSRSSNDNERRILNERDILERIITDAVDNIRVEKKAE